MPDEQITNTVIPTHLAFFISFSSKHQPSVEASTA